MITSKTNKISYNCSKQCRQLSDFAPPKETLGYVIANQDGGLPYLDFDTDFMNITEDVTNLIKKFELGTYAVIKTRKGCHVVFDDFRSWEQILEIMKSSEKVDPQFYQLKKDLGYSRIRVDKKYAENDLKLQFITTTPFSKPETSRFKMLIEMVNSLN